MVAGDTMPGTSGQSLLQAASIPTPSTYEPFPTETSDPSSHPLASTAHLNASIASNVPNVRSHTNQPHASSSSQHLHNDPFPRSLPPASSVTSTQGNVEAHLTQHPQAQPPRPQTPPQNSEGRFICTYPGCNKGATFKWLSGLK